MGASSDMTFQLQKQTAANIVDHYRISETTQIGVITYHNSATDAIPYDQYDDNLSLTKAILSLKHAPGPSQIEGALAAALDVLKSGKKDASLSQMIVLMIDNKIGKDAVEKVKKLKEYGVEVVVVAFGNNVDQNELDEISDNKGKQITDEGDVDKVIKDLIDLLKKGMKYY